MRKKVIIANWKMNKTRDEALDFIYAVKEEIPAKEKVETVICAQPILLRCLVKRQGDNIRIGAENMHYLEKGAFTGEVSPLCLTTTGVEYVILGHSERRHIFNESNEFVNLKVLSALDHGLVPILCVGETLEERDRAEEVLRLQVTESLKGVNDIVNVIIGYEPVWAIGTGHSANPDDAEKRIRFIRNLLKEKYGIDALKVRIVYGGSVCPDNIREFLNEEDIDGALIGNSALDAKNFIKMANAAK